MRCILDVFFSRFRLSVAVCLRRERKGEMKGKQQSRKREVEVEKRAQEKTYDTITLAVSVQTVQLCIKTLSSLLNAKAILLSYNFLVLNNNMNNDLSVRRSQKLQSEYRPQEREGKK